LDDAEGVVCLPNEEIFAGLAQMGYEKPSTKVTFYKAFFSSQWKFLIHTILQSLSAKRTSWNEFSTAMASANQVGDLSTHTTRFISLDLTQKVFANIRRIGKDFSGVETPLFEGMLAARQPAEEGLADEQVQVDADVAAAVQENVAEDVPYDAIPSPPSHDIPSPPQEHPLPPQQPQSSPQAPPQVADLPTHIQQVLDVCSVLTRRVENLEKDKAAQKLEIIKLKARVKKLEMANKVKSSKLRHLRKVGASMRIESSDDMDDVFNQGRMIDDMDKDEGIELVKDANIAKSEGRHAAAEQAVKQAEIYHIDLDHSSKVLSMQEDDSEVQEVVEVVTTAKLITDVVTAASQSKEEIEEEDQEIIKIINETPAQKAAKKRKLSEEAQEAEDLRKRLEVVDDEDDDVFIEVTPLARKDPGENSSQSPPHIDHHCCYGCGDSLDGVLCQRCTCVSCGNSSHIGYNCLSKVPIISNSKPCYNQNVDEFPQTLPSFHPTCYYGDENSFTYDSNLSFVDDSPNLPPQPPTYSYKILIYYDDDDGKESSTPLRDIIISELPPCIAITPVLSTEEPKDSLIMGDEHLDTIPEKESNDFIKSSVENLVPNPKSLLNQDSLIISSSKIDSLLDEFAGELIFLKSTPLGIDEADCDPGEEIRLIDKLFNDFFSLPKNESFHFDVPSSPRPPAKPPDDDAIEPDTGILTVKVVGDISEHYVLMPRLFLTQPTLASNKEKSPQITKLETRVKKLERANKVKALKLRRLRKVGISQRVDTSDDTIMKDVSNQGRMIDELDKDEDAALMMEVVTTAKLITEVVATVSEAVSAASANIAVDVITAALVKITAASTRRRRGVVIRDPEEESTTEIPDETKSKDKGKGIMVEEPKPMKKKQQVEMDEALDYFKGMSYDDIHLIFKAKFNTNIKFLLKSKEEIEEEENRALESINETPAQKATKRRRLNEEAEDVEDLK
nr:hypothetical protein [Tanacetum cinerariifolium]